MKDYMEENTQVRQRIDLKGTAKLQAKQIAINAAEGAVEPLQQFAFVLIKELSDRLIDLIK